MYAVWNTSAGDDSLASSSGYSNSQYWYLDSPQNVFDGNLSSVFAIYGVCNVSFTGIECGLNTGVYVTRQKGPFILTAFRIVTGHVSRNRDPIMLTIEGSNQNGATLILGSSWTLLYNGTAGLDIHPGILKAGTRQTIVDNQMQFASYRFLVTEKRGNHTCVEYAEIQLFGM